MYGNAHTAVFSASASISPSSGAKTPGNTFSVSVLSDTASVPITTAEIRVVIPKNAFAIPTNYVASTIGGFSSTVDLISTDALSYQLLFTGNVLGGTPSITLTNNTLFTFSVTPLATATSGQITISAADSYLVAYNGGTILSPFTITNASYTFPSPTNTPQPTATPIEPTNTPQPTSAPTCTPPSCPAPAANCQYIEATSCTCGTLICSTSTPPPAATSTPSTTPRDTFVCPTSDDVNGNGTIDIFDMATILLNRGTTATDIHTQSSDIACDGSITNFDVVKWIRNILTLPWR